MPHWLDNLTNPLVPQRAIAGLRNALAPGSGDVDIQGGIGDIPGALQDVAGNLGDFPMETLGGFASGALEGLRGLTTPLDALGLAMPAFGAAKGILRLPKSISPLEQMAVGAAGGVGRGLDLVDDIPGMGNLSVGAKGPMTPPRSPAMPRRIDAPPPGYGPIDMPPAAFGHGMPDYVPVGGEAAFNALRQPNLGVGISNASPMRQTLDEITSEVGPEGLRDLMKRPIPQRQVQAPPRMK